MTTTITLSVNRTLTIAGDADSFTMTFDPPLKRPARYSELTEEERYRMKMGITAYRIGAGSTSALANHAETMKEAHGSDAFIPGGVAAGCKSIAEQIEDDRFR